MKCPACPEYFNATHQSVVCPHLPLSDPPVPQGGPRLTQEQRAAILEAYRMQDRMALYRLMGHGNPAVRVLAQQMSDLLDEVSKPVFGVGAVLPPQVPFVDSISIDEGQD